MSFLHANYFIVVFSLSLVDLISCHCHFICPLSVPAKLSGKCFSTAFVVNTGHVDSWLLLVALRSLFWGGQKIH